MHLSKYLTDGKAATAGARLVACKSSPRMWAPAIEAQI